MQSDAHTCCQIAVLVSVLRTTRTAGPSHLAWQVLVAQQRQKTACNAVVQVLTLEDWEAVMFSVMRASGAAGHFIFFVIWLVVGKYPLLSLFLAVIMEAFEVAHDRQEAERRATMAAPASEDEGVQWKPLPCCAPRDLL